jgi:hypothetical protein
MGPTTPVLVSVTPPFEDVHVALYREIAAPLFAGARNPDFERTGCAGRKSETTLAPHEADRGREPNDPADYGPHNSPM